MPVEPARLCWPAGRQVEARDGVTRAAELERWPALVAVVRDGGAGLSKGIEPVRARRRDQRGTGVGDGLDVFHAPRAGGRASRATRAEAGHALGRAEAAQRQFDQRRRQGRSDTGPGPPSRRPWAAAGRAFARAEAAEAARGRARAAPDLFTPECRLDGRPRAEAVVRAALPELGGSARAKVRRLLSRPESFPFLDQAARRPAELGLQGDVPAASLESEGLRRRPRRSRGSTPSAAAARGLAPTRAVPLAKASPAWRDQAAAVHRVLRGVGRASSLVECVDGAARMRQSRHRKMTQGLLDLERLHWDLRRFRTGRRKGQAPYGLLGLKVPELNFGESLKLSPEELRQQLSAPGHGP